MTVIPQLQSPPRVRVEWVIAGARVVLAAGSLLALLVEPRWDLRVLVYLLGWYLVYSLALLALVWTPNRFGRGWDIALHVVDLAVLAAWTLLPHGVPSPIIVYFVFVAVCAILRWQTAGLVWTALASIGAFLAASLYTHRVLAVETSVAAVAARSTHLVLITTFLAYLGGHQHRFQFEISRLASWPRKPVRDGGEVVAEIVQQSSQFLDAPRTVVVWEEPGESWINVAWCAAGEVVCVREPEAAYGAFVAPELEAASFQVRDASDARGRVLILRDGGFRRRTCRPVHEALRARFNMHAVQSWPLTSELIRGRLFCLDRDRMRLDDLVLGEVVAGLAVTRLESLHWQKRLREAAALDERVRLARDLHDSLLQAQAGAALQLVSARRLLDRDPAAGRERLADVQRQLERDELEMRTFVSRLRPDGRPVLATPTPLLAERLDELRRRVERQWDVHVHLRLDALPQLPDTLAEAVYRLLQEGVVNAARHADASVVHVTLRASDGRLRLTVADDGCGFAFRGAYDLETLNRLHQGPLTLRERVGDLGGDLQLTSTDAGTTIDMTLPVAAAG